jgi:signal transduction histidine kinase
VRLERRVRLQVRVRGDRVLLMRALGNLLSNAFKHAPPGSAVRVRLQSRRDGVWLSVSDQGPGMPLDMRVRLFQRFATGSVRKGNGLGLAMVARAARVHQARIEVDSEVGRGTTVALVLNAERDGG